MKLKRKKEQRNNIEIMKKKNKEKRKFKGSI